MRITKQHTYFEISEAKIEEKFKVAIVDKSEFGIAIYLTIQDLMTLNDGLGKLLKRHVDDSSGLKKGK